jgi:hypothetical protein
MARQVEFTISWSAIAKVLVAILVSYLLVRLWPLLERIWLLPYLEPDTVKKHVEIDEQEHS